MPSGSHRSSAHPSSAPAPFSPPNAPDPTRGFPNTNKSFSLMSIKTTHPVVRASLGIAALVLIAIFANWLVSLTSIGNHGKDFTENKIHTLSDGTRSILAELDSPVTIRYYASRNTTYMPEEVKLHTRRVDDLPKEYAKLSKGKLRVESLAPQPDTDAEDSANLDGI